MSFRVGEAVRLRGTKLRGHIVSFVVRDGEPKFALVAWADKRIVPNPGLEAVDNLETVVGDDD